MSWDVMILSRDPGPDALASDVKVPPLGDADFVRAQISKSLPQTNWSDPAWGVLEGRGWSIEFNHQKSGSTESIMLHVRGGGDPVSAIVKLCQDTGWVALDLQSEKLIDLKAPSSQSWKEFQGFRDKVVASTAAPAQQPRDFASPPIYTAAGAILLVLVLWLLMRK